MRSLNLKTVALASLVSATHAQPSQHPMHAQLLFTDITVHAISMGQVGSLSEVRLFTVDM